MDKSTTQHHNVSSSTCIATDVNDDVILQAILPVNVYQKGRSSVIKTYAFYDNGSTGCFITDELLTQLGATCVETHLQLRTMHGKSVIASNVVRNLVVTDLMGDNAVDLPTTYTRDDIPVGVNHIPRPEMLQKWTHLQHVANDVQPIIPDLKVGILIGSNCPAALEPMEVVPIKGLGPFATRLRHGWTIYGPLEVKYQGSDDVTVNRIIIQEVEKFKETLSPIALQRMSELDFNDHVVESYPDEKGMSHEDVIFMEKAKQGLSFSDGHYTVPLQFRDEHIRLPDNKSPVLKRTLWQKNKMLKDEKYRSDYITFVENIIDRQYASIVPDHSKIAPPGQVWYLPHHAIYNPNKPDKIRIVFDCSAIFNGTCLNDHLMQGPDLTNSLVGILMRFRQESTAFMADIESMFFQVRVPPEQRSYLRFMWWPGGNIHEALQEYQMNVHLFGAVSSPSVVNFVLRIIGELSPDLLVSQTIHRHFYVDDCLRSVESSNVAIKLAQDLMDTCNSGGFRLTKFTSNSQELMNSIPTDEHSKDMRTRNLDYDDLPVMRALGVQWSVESDTFGFSIIIKNKPPTRRGILSVVSSLYDPLGFVAPVILQAKKILQDLCRETNLCWDDEVPNEYAIRWYSWLQTLPELEKLTIDRCLKPMDFTNIISRQLHVFSDASTLGYGSVAYLRLTNSDNRHHVAFVMGKARLAPLKPTTIPKLELTAAVTSVRLAHMILREMDDSVEVTYHTDSTTVIKYIANERSRFPVFVTNRVRLIRDFSSIDQWRYVPSSSNPADDSSRGLTVSEITQNSRWLCGPAFLHTDESIWDDRLPHMESKHEHEAPDGRDDVTVNIIISNEAHCSLTKLMTYFSDWYKLRKAVAVFLKVKELLRHRVCINVKY